MNKLDIKIALRNITRQKFYSILNIIGLSMGLSLVLFIGLYLYEQFSYDKWYEHDRIYRVEMGDWAILGPVYSKIIQPSSANIEKTLRVDSNWGQGVAAKIESRSSSVKIPNVVLADSAFFDFFPFRFIHGDPVDALNSKNKVVLTRSQAINIFGKTDVVGETLKLQDKHLLTVSGVIEDVKHFHLPINAIGSFNLYSDILYPGYFDSPGDWNHNTYVKLHTGADVADTEKAIGNAVVSYMNESFGVSLDRKVSLRKVSDIYFTNEKLHEITVIHGNKMYSYGFLMIAGFILLIAIINFVNLSTASSASRARETGIRKLLGSTRSKIIYQFLLEAVILTLASMLIAFSITELFLPYFNYVTNSDNSLLNVGWLSLTSILVGSTLIIGMLSGAYPAFYLSKFQPARILKGEITRGKGAAFFRKSLIVVQFTISIALIAGTIILYQQLNYLRQKDTGFNKEGIIHFRLNGKVSSGWESFRNSLQTHPQITSVALSNTIPGSVRWQESYNIDNKNFQYTYWPMTPEYFDMLELNLIKGRVFTRENPSDEGFSVVVNEQWIWQSGIPFNSFDDLIGMSIDTEYKKQRIVGVVADFHFNSLHEAIGPLMMVWRNNSSFTANVKVNMSDLPAVIAHIEESWNALSPEEAISWNLLSDSLEKLYDGEKRMGIIFLSFSSFAVIIAFMGLFGLASFMVEKRTREISIRKILGATPGNLMVLLSKEFFALLFLALIVAVPLGWIAMHNWLESYSSRISISAIPFLASATTAIILLIITMGYHVMKISHHNPSESLNKE